MYKEKNIEIISSENEVIMMILGKFSLKMWKKVAWEMSSNLSYVENHGEREPRAPGDPGQSIFEGKKKHQPEYSIMLTKMSPLNCMGLNQQQFQPHTPNPPPASET